MKNVQLFTAFLAFTYAMIVSPSSLFSQNAPVTCGTPEPTSPPEPLLEKNHCFDVGLIQQTCTKVWIRVNVHFFLDDNCNGTLDPLGIENIPIEKAYEVAEDWVNRANTQLGPDMYKQWAQIPLWGINQEKPVQCIPIRYALSGVYIHCNTQALNTSGLQVAWFRDNFGINITSEFNAFLVELPAIASQNPSGAADGYGGTSFTSEIFTRSNINHEMGHVLTLRHTFDLDDYCDDTPNIIYRIDYNCDGDVTDNWTLAGGLSELEVHRGIWCHPDDVNCGLSSQITSPLDYDGDGIINYQNPCNPQQSELPPGSSLQGCLPEPGCSWDYHTNNIMHYSQYTDCCGAFTENQITRMLEYLSTPEGCLYKEVITDDICLPPMSNLHILPNESVDDDCAFCFQIGASMHDAYYKLEFFTVSDALQYSTGWVTGPALKYCISRSVKYATEYRHGFVPGVSYKAVLTVENVCGEESSEALTFTLPPLPAHGCVVEPTSEIAIDNLYPNPFVDMISMDYSAERTGYLNIWLVAQNSGVADIYLGSEYVNAAGTYSKTLFPPSSIPSGLYYLALDFDGLVVSNSIIKN